MAVETGILRSFENYLATLEDFLAGESDAIRERKMAYIQRNFNLPRSEIEKRMEGDEIANFVFLSTASFEPEFWGHHDYEYNFPNILRTSFFLALYAQCEHFLDSQCDWLHDTKKLTLSLRDLAGKGIIRARKYIVKVAEVGFPDSKEWQEITVYGKLRNCIAHNNGELDRLSEKDSRFLREYISGHPYLELREYPMATKFEFQRGFCEEALVTIDAFNQQLIDCR